jgi:uncharacterized membrane protein
MNLDTTIFFIIVIGGVVAIWSFRRIAGRTGDMKEIEYLSFASIWGTVLVITYYEISKRLNEEAFTQLLNNPLASALVFALVGLIVGTFFGWLDNEKILPGIYRGITMRIFKKETK